MDTLEFLTAVMSGSSIGEEATVQVPFWRDLEYLRIWAVKVGQAGWAAPHPSLRRLRIVCPRRLFAFDGQSAAELDDMAHNVAASFALDCPWLHVRVNLIGDDQAGEPCSPAHFV